MGCYYWSGGATFPIKLTHGYHHFVNKDKLYTWRRQCCLRCDFTLIFECLKTVLRKILETEKSLVSHGTWRGDPQHPELCDISKSSVWYQYPAYDINTQCIICWSAGNHWKKNKVHSLYANSRHCSCFPRTTRTVWATIWFVVADIQLRFSSPIFYDSKKRRIGYDSFRRRNCWLQIIFFC